MEHTIKEYLHLDPESFMDLVQASSEDLKIPVQYKSQVALLVRIMPLVYRIKNFAVHGGTAINLFHQNMPRYSYRK